LEDVALRSAGRNIRGPEMSNARLTRVAKVIHIDGRHPQRAVRRQVKVHVANAGKIGDHERKDLNVKFAPKVVLAEPRDLDVKFIPKVIMAEPRDLDVKFVPKVVMAEPKILNVKLVIHEEERYVARVRYARSR
jgi:hypothetical protein